ncbi:MAG: SLC13 family permease, partial [Acidobacteriota bacterium]
FMLASAFLSLWISNTATAMMMMPIALSVIIQMPRSAGDGAGDEAIDGRFSLALLLGVAYACSVGGAATLIGTPTNALLAGYLLETYGYDISFAAWMSIGLPVAAVGLGVVFLMLTRGLADGEPVSQDLFARERRDLGPMSLAEGRVAAVFLGTAGLWLGRTALDDWIPGLSDTGIALFGALLLFAWPMPRPEGSPRRAGDALGVLDWSATARLPWGVLLLFGGGLSLAAAIQTTGLASWIGGGLGALDALPIFGISLATVALVVILTELTSNTATAAAFLPVLAALGVGLGEDPLLLLVPATLAASCAFMLPVATPPNAIVYGSGRVTLPQMVRAGWRLNLIFIPLITGLCYGLLTALLGVQAGVLPPWATP